MATVKKIRKAFDRVVLIGIWSRNEGKKTPKIF